MNIVEKAQITGITFQDGVSPAERLLAKAHAVHGCNRAGSRCGTSQRR